MTAGKHGATDDAAFVFPFDDRCSTVDPDLGQLRDGPWQLGKDCIRPGTPGRYRCGTTPSKRREAPSLGSPSFIWSVGSAAALILSMRKEKCPLSLSNTDKK